MIAVCAMASQYALFSASNTRGGIDGRNDREFDQPPCSALDGIKLSEKSPAKWPATTNG